MATGALEFVVVGFPGQKLDPDVAKSLTELVRADVIRIVDLLFVTKGLDGTVAHRELEELDSSDSALLASITQEMDGLIGEEDVEDIAAELPAGTMAAILLFEHSWMSRLRGAVKASGGQVVLSQRIPAYVVEALAAGEV